MLSTILEMYDYSEWTDEIKMVTATEASNDFLHYLYACCIHIISAIIHLEIITDYILTN